MARDISNSADMIDSRDIIERIEELEQERIDAGLQTGQAAIDNHEDAASAADLGITALEEWDASDDGQELAALKSLAEEAEGYAPDWAHGATLVRDSYFTEYAQEMLEDCGDLPKDLPGYIAIDWDMTAENIQADYTSIDYDGVTYWIH